MSSLTGITIGGKNVAGFGGNSVSKNSDGADISGTPQRNLTHGNNPHNDKSVYSQFKLFDHTDKLEQWLRQGYTNAPVILDLDLTDKCNHGCPLCIYHNTNSQKDYIPFDKAKEIITDAAEMGSRAITFAGGGDPSCHPRFEEVIRHARSQGLETACFSNCYELPDSLINTIVKECTWMRVSLDADGPEIYKKTHGMGAEEFHQAIGNVRKITERAKQTGSEIVVGICYLIGPHTIPGMYNGAKLAKELGAQQIRFRPFFNFEDDRPSIEDLLGAKVKYGGNREKILGEMEAQLVQARTLVDDTFDVSVPGYRLTALHEGPPRGFPVCHYPHFSASITADMKLYPCCPLKGYPEYAIGDMANASFREVWNSAERRKVTDKVDFKRCPNPCQFDGHARTLYGIKEAQNVGHKSFL